MDNTQKKLQDLYRTLHAHVQYLQYSQLAYQKQYDDLLVKLGHSSDKIESYLGVYTGAYDKLLSHLTECEEKHAIWTQEHTNRTQMLQQTIGQQEARALAMNLSAEEKDLSDTEYSFHLLSTYKNLQDEKIKLGRIQMVIEGEIQPDTDIEQACGKDCLDVWRLKETLLAQKSKLDMVSHNLLQCETCMSDVQRGYINVLVQQEKIRVDPTRGLLHMVSLERENIERSMKFMQKLKKLGDKYGVNLEFLVPSASIDLRSRIHTINHMVSDHTTTDPTLQQIKLFECNNLKQMLATL
jgi:hypothetical protein